MANTSNSIANQAIQLMGGNQPLVTGNSPTFDNSPNGIALQKLYVPTVRTVMRQFSWDFSRVNLGLSLSGNTAPFPWAYEYLYPTNAVQVWQLAPPSLTDVNNPLPVNWIVGNNTVSSNTVRVIWTNQVNALGVYDSFPPESTWDDGFVEAVVRLLASNLASATAGKPDVSKDQLEAGGAFNQIAQERDS